MKPLPRVWNYTPLIKTAAGLTLMTPNAPIYLRDDVYRDLLTKQPTPQNISRLKHEETHRERIKRIGWIKYAVKWLLPEFRLSEELIAYKSSMQIYRKYGLTFDIERIAQLLSSSLYLWAASYKRARLELEKAWKEQH